MRLSFACENFCLLAKALARTNHKDSCNRAHQDINFFPKWMLIAVGYLTLGSISPLDDQLS